MSKRLAAFYYALSFGGTTSYCILWIDFSWEPLNILWLAVMTVAGFSLEIQRTRRADCEPQVVCRRLHLSLSGIIAALVIAWPGIALPMGLYSAAIWGPPHAPLVALLSLAPYSLPLFAWMMGYRRPSPGFLERWPLSSAMIYGLTLVLILPSLLTMGMWLLGNVIWSDGHPVMAEEVLTSPGRLMIARHEIRQWMGGVFPDSQGRVWISPRVLPIRIQVGQYLTDGPIEEVIRWSNVGGLDFTLPKGAHGGSSAPARIFGLIAHSR